MKLETKTQDRELRQAYESGRWATPALTKPEANDETKRMHRRRAAVLEASLQSARGVKTRPRCYPNKTTSEKNSALAAVKVTGIRPRHRRNAGGSTTEDGAKAIKHPKGV